MYTTVLARPRYYIGCMGAAVLQCSWAKVRKSTLCLLPFFALLVVVYYARGIALVLSCYLVKSLEMGKFCCFFCVLVASSFPCCFYRSSGLGWFTDILWWTCFAQTAWRKVLLIFHFVNQLVIGDASPSPLPLDPYTPSTVGRSQIWTNITVLWGMERPQGNILELRASGVFRFMNLRGLSWRGWLGIKTTSPQLQATW